MCSDIRLVVDAIVVCRLFAVVGAVALVNSTTDRAPHEKGSGVECFSRSSRHHKAAIQTARCTPTSICAHFLILTAATDDRIVLFA